MTYLERSPEDLEMETEVHDLDEPYYHKATIGFEEGSAQSLLLKRVQTSRDGRFLLLHNKWRDMDFDSLSPLNNRDASQEPESNFVDACLLLTCSFRTKIWTNFVKAFKLA